MSILYVLIAIVVVLGLVAGQMLVLRHRWMEYAAASLQIRAIRPRVFLRTLLACFVSGAYMACYILGPVRVPSHWAFVVCLDCVPAVIFFFFVPLPPTGLIATFGTGTARVIWSVVFGGSFVVIPAVVLEVLGFSGVFS
jgi:hypothetical protein